MESWVSNVLSSNGIVDCSLKIDDLDSLKITKISYNKLYFTYRSIRYFIISNYDCGDQWFSLYKKEFIEGKWSVTPICSSGWCIADILDLIDDKARLKKNIVYSHIDKNYFVRKLIGNNLVTG